MDVVMPLGFSSLVILRKDFIIATNLPLEMYLDGLT